MDEKRTTRIQQLIQDGYEFRFGDYIGKGFDLFKKNMGGFILFTVVFIVVYVVINFIPVIGAIANALIISPVLLVGAYLVAHKVDEGQATEFSDFFKGFDFVKQLAMTALFQSVIIYASLIPFALAVQNTGIFQWYMEAATNPMGAMDSMPELPMWSVILIAPAIYLSIAYSWSYLFVAFYNMRFWDAMESSRKLISKKWLTIFAFSIVIGLIVGVGAILLCVGIFATLPAALCMQYAAFKDVTQLERDSETSGDDLEQHLVD